MWRVRGVWGDLWGFEGGFMGFWGGVHGISRVVRMIWGSGRSCGGGMLAGGPGSFVEVRRFFLGNGGLREVREAPGGGVGGGRGSHLLLPGGGVEDDVPMGVEGAGDTAEEGGERQPRVQQPHAGGIQTAGEELGGVKVGKNPKIHRRQRGFPPNLHPTELQKPSSQKAPKVPPHRAPKALAVTP